MGLPVSMKKGSCEELPADESDKSALTVDNIYDFIQNVDTDRLSFLDECIKMNWAVAQEGLKGALWAPCGTKYIYEDMGEGTAGDDIRNYAIAVTAAAADARMAGCAMSVMTECGSGNQGLNSHIAGYCSCL